MFLLTDILPNQVWPQLPALLFTFVRIGALLVAAPMFGARTVPVRVRIALAALIALVMFPSVTPPADLDLVSAAAAVMIGREILIGVSLGFLVQLVFSAVATAGELVALSMGLAFASVVDPERGTSVPVVGQHFVVLSTLIFLALDGHLALLLLLGESFVWLPPSTAGLGANGFAEIALWMGEALKSAVLVALPASTALLVSGVSMGLIARSAPQLNIFAVGFPMTLMLGIVALLFSLPLLAPQLEQMLAQVLAAGQAVVLAWQ